MSGDTVWVVVVRACADCGHDQLLKVFSRPPTSAEVSDLAGPAICSKTFVSVAVVDGVAVEQQ